MGNFRHSGTEAITKSSFFAMDARLRRALSGVVCLARRWNTNNGEEEETK